MKKNQSSEVCMYCFGAGELTKDGKLPVPCPLCKGGTLTAEELKKANKKLKTYIRLTEDDD
jgi:DnaJ-class molecular chaperone